MNEVLRSGHHKDAPIDDTGGYLPQLFTSDERNRTDLYRPRRSIKWLVLYIALGMGLPGLLGIFLILQKVLVCGGYCSRQSSPHAVSSPHPLGRWPPEYCCPQVHMIDCLSPALWDDQGGELFSEPIVFRMAILDIPTKYLFLTACAVISDVYVIFRVCLPAQPPVQVCLSGTQPAAERRNRCLQLSAGHPPSCPSCCAPGGP